MFTFTFRIIVKILSQCCGIIFHSYTLPEPWLSIRKSGMVSYFRDGGKAAQLKFFLNCHFFVLEARPQKTRQSFIWRANPCGIRPSALLPGDWEGPLMGGRWIWRIVQSGSYFPHCAIPQRNFRVSLSTGSGVGHLSTYRWLDVQSGSHNPEGFLRETQGRVWLIAEGNCEKQSMVTWPQEAMREIMRHCFNVILISGKVPALSAPGLVVYCYMADMWRDVEL